METLKKLKEQRAAKVDEMKALNALAEKENRNFSDDENAKWTASEKEIADIDAAIKRAEFLQAEQRANAKPVTSPVSFDTSDGEEKEIRKMQKGFKIAKLVRAQITGQSLDGIEKEVDQIGREEARQHNFQVGGYAIPSSFVKSAEQRAHDVATAASLGRLVDTELEYVPYIYPITVLDKLGATFVRGLRSNWTWVRNDNELSGTWEGETDANAESTMTVENVALTPKRLGTYATTSKQLMMQAEVVDVNRELLAAINKGIGKTLELAAFNGSGSAPIPRGVLQTSGIGDAAIGTNGGAPTWAKIVELESDLLRYNMGNTAYLTTYGMRGKLKTVTKDSGSGLFLASENGTMNGYPLFVSENLPTDLVKGSSSDCHPIIFADWSSLYVCQWGGIDIVVDGITLAASAQVKLIVNSWWDIGLRYKGSFAACQDARVA